MKERRKNKHEIISKKAINKKQGGCSNEVINQWN